MPPLCPECSAVMRPYRRGASRQKHGPAYMCPAAEKEVTRDERGHLVRAPDAKHATTRVWTQLDLFDASKE